MAKRNKKKSGSKKGNKKKIKFNKGTSYEVEYAWVEAKEPNIFTKIWIWIKNQF